jgi:hypothetical protein
VGQFVLVNMPVTSNGVVIIRELQSQRSLLQEVAMKVMLVTLDTYQDDRSPLKEVVSTGIAAMRVTLDRSPTKEVAS